MAALEPLPLVASNGKPLIHKFYRQENDPAGLLIALPGNHYGVDGPLLYYPSKILLDAGWDTLALTYGYQSAGVEFDHEMVPGVVQECQDAVRHVLSKRDYPNVCLVGKSLGAFVIAQLCNIKEMLEAARCVYVTPPLGTPFFHQLFQASSQPAHIALGTKDRFYTQQALIDLKTKHPFSLTLIDNADHSMNVAGDLDASIEAVRRVTQEGVNFILGKQ
jgi:alpha/beta superfamily hydrolase